MAQQRLKNKIFLDSGDPAETREILSTFGFLDGQTTNPSLIAKNPDTTGKKFGKKDLLEFYRKVVAEISLLIPQGSVSIEVYADAHTSAEEMFKQGKEFNTWISNAHIKYPTTAAGLEAAEKSVKDGMKVNMTLVFSQAQAAAVYAATKGAKKGDVFVSPFVGRLDDRGEKGMDLIANIVKMYKQGDGHVEVLTASVRSLSHMAEAVNFGSDIITAPLKILKEWHEQITNNKSQITNRFQNSNLKPIPFKTIDINRSWNEYDIHHELTDKGIERFAADWNSLIL